MIIEEITYHVKFVSRFRECPFNILVSPAFDLSDDDVRACLFMIKRMSLHSFSCLSMSLVVDTLYEAFSKFPDSVWLKSLINWNNRPNHESPAFNDWFWIEAFPALMSHIFCLFNSGDDLKVYFDVHPIAFSDIKIYCHSDQGEDVTDQFL